jgi:hypothetical protein
VEDHVRPGELEAAEQRGRQGEVAAELPDAVGHLPGVLRPRQAPELGLRCGALQVLDEVAADETRDAGDQDAHGDPR